MAVKLVVTARKGGSRIALVGSSGTELLASKVFVEPRAKGATLRSLKGILGNDIVVEDHTVSTLRGAAPVAEEVAEPKKPKAAKATKAPARKATRRPAKAAAK